VPSTLGYGLQQQDGRINSQPYTQPLLSTEGMAYAERDSFAKLKIDTNWIRGHSPSTGRGHGEDGRGVDDAERRNDGSTAPDNDDENSIIDELHTDTPPISVPRADDHSFEDAPPDISFSHRPGQYSPPFEDFIRERRPSVSFNPEIKLDTGHCHVLDEPLVGGDVRGTAYSRPQPRQSALRQMQSHEGEETFDYNGPRTTTPMRARPGYRHSSTGNSSFDLAGTEQEALAGAELDQPTSLTSVSTVSPTTDEVRTPSEGPREGPKDMLLSPLSTSPIVQRAASLDDPSLWSPGAGDSFGKKARSYTFERNGSLRQSMRQASRRSTGSSGKSPASAFLSMWTSPEETAPASQPDDEGQMVGTEYVLGKQIGFGGFSTVKEAYKVEESGGTKRLAVKIVKKHVTGKSERENDQVQAEFDHEVRIWRYLHHPHILSLEAVYETDYATFCFTKLAIGGTLFDLIKSHRSGLDMTLAKKYSYQLASAIRYLHEDARVVHRDIKLENCLLDPVKSEDGTETANLVLCDFGMAEWMTTDNVGGPLDPYDNPADRPPPKNIGPSGSSTSVAGSLEYASPELLQSSAGLIDPTVDVWAFGVVVYATIAGSRPFQHGFAPRVQANIIKGEWDQQAVLANSTDLGARQEALQLMRGCLEMDTKARWTIRRVLDCTWLQGCAEIEEATDESHWKL
jgi:serine/threonine protein kinase